MASSPIPDAPEPDREYPIGDTLAINPQWNLAAAQIGSTLGQAVNRARQAPQRARQAARQIGDELRDRFSLMMTNPNLRADLRREAEEAVEELESHAREGAQIARNRAEVMARQNPMAFIAAAFAAAFIFGITLRIWRSGRG